MFMWMEKVNEFVYLQKRIVLKRGKYMFKWTIISYQAINIVHIGIVVLFRRTKTPKKIKIVFFFNLMRSARIIWGLTLRDRLINSI